MTEKVAEGVVYEVEPGRKVAVGAPSLLVLPNGRLLAGFDLTGPDAKGLPGQRGHDKVRNRWVQTKVFSSVDGGETWTGVASLGVRCGRMFRDGGDVWLLGELNGALWLARSPDGGGSWSTPAALGAEEGYTGAVTRPLQVGGTWFMAAWRGGEWVLWKAPAGTNLSGKKAWQRREGTAGGEAEALLKAGAPGAGVPAAGMQAGWGGGGAMVELPEGHPWGTGAAAVFAVKAGRADWALALRCGGGERWAGLAGGAAAWGWVPWPGGHAAFSVAAEGGAWWCAGNAAGTARWGRGVHEESKLTEIGLWRSADGMEWERRGTLCAGAGEGASAVRRDPSLAAGANGQLWMACRAGTGASRSARDMLQIRWTKGPTAR